MAIPADDPSLWQPLFAVLRDLRPARLPSLGYQGSISVRSRGGHMTFDRGVGVEFDDLHALNTLGPVLGSIAATLGQSGQAAIAVSARVPGNELLVVDLDGRLKIGGTPTLEVIHLEPGAGPSYFHQPITPRADAAPAPTVDVPAMLATIEPLLDGAAGVDPQLLADTEARLGVPLTDELRALYGRVAGGTYFGKPVDEDDDYVDQMVSIIPLDHTDNHRRSFTTFDPGWRLSADDGAWADPTGRIQPTASSPYWFPFADDGGGNYWAVDLAPGPAGHLGQVLFFDHEQGYLNPQVAAESLTDFYVNDRGYPAGRGPDGHDQRLVISTTSRRINAIKAPSLDTPGLPLDAIEVLWIEGSAPPVWFGRPLPRLRTLHLGALPVEPRQLTGMGTVEYLSADLVVWRALLDAGAVPPGLRAAGFHEDAEHDWPAQLVIINALLALRGQPPVTTGRSPGPDTA